MTDETEILSRYGLALIQAVESAEVYKSGEIKDPDIKSHIRQLREKAVNHYKTKATRLGIYMMSSSPPSAKSELNANGLTVIAVMLAQHCFRDMENTNITFLARASYLADPQNKSIRFHTMLLHELIFAGIIHLHVTPKNRYIDTNFPPAVCFGKNILKDCMDAIPLSVESIRKEKRIRRRRRNRRQE